MTRILLVDDDANVRDALSTVLGVAGHEVVAAQNGRDALDIVPNAHPQVIVSDVTMPLMDGVEMVRRIKATPGFEQVPVILMSARLTHATVPVAAILRKPFAPSQLLTVLDGLTADTVASSKRVRRAPLSVRIGGEEKQSISDGTLASSRDEKCVAATERCEHLIRRGIELVEAQEKRLHRLRSLGSNTQLGDELHEQLMCGVAALVRLERISH